MPLAGTRDSSALVEGAAELPGYGTDALTLERVEIMQVMYEIDADAMLSALPPALNPTIPPTVTWQVWRCKDGDLGPFNLALTRVGSRAGVRPRGLLIGAVIDSDGAAKELASRWGIGCRIGDVRLTRYHDRAVAEVSIGGARALEVSVVDPEPISGGDVQYVATMTPAHTPDGPRLVQIDPDYTFHRAERGRPLLSAFDAAAWGDAALLPRWPVSASMTVADVTLPKLRYVCRLDIPAFQGTEKIGG